MSTHEVILVRHAQASFGADDYDQLSALGQAQAQRLGTWLAETGQAPVRVVIGPRRRHRQTAQICLDAAGLASPLQVLDGLDEMDHLELLLRRYPELTTPAALRAALAEEADPHRAFQKMFIAAVARWMDPAHESDYAITWQHFRRNVQQAWQQISGTLDGPVWAFTSGGPIGVLAAAAVGVPDEHAFGMVWPLANAGLTRMRAGRQHPALISYNTWPHLEHHAHKHLLTMR